MGPHLWGQCQRARHHDELCLLRQKGIPGPRLLPVPLDDGGMEQIEQLDHDGRRDPLVDQERVEEALAQQATLELGEERGVVEKGDRHTGGDSKG